MRTMDFTMFVEWGFYGIISLSVMIGVKILSQLKNSINSLNIQVARILEKSSWHEKELMRHEGRLTKLEEN